LEESYYSSWSIGIVPHHPAPWSCRRHDHGTQRAVLAALEGFGVVIGTAEQIGFPVLKAGNENRSSPATKTSDFMTFQKDNFKRCGFMGFHGV